MKEQNYISTTEAATLLGVSRVAVFKNIQNGKIKAKKVGRNYIIDKNSLGGIYKTITPDEEKQVTRVMNRVITEFEPALKRLSQE